MRRRRERRVRVRVTVMGERVKEKRKKGQLFQSQRCSYRVLSLWK